MPFAYLMLAALAFFNGSWRLGISFIAFAGLSWTVHNRAPSRRRASNGTVAAALVTLTIGFLGVWYGLRHQVLLPWLGGMVLIVGMDGVASWRSFRSSLRASASVSDAG